MNIEQLRHFSEIARCGSINAATETLYITQPSLSASIRKLESELGEKVFVRGNNGVTLTPFGEELLPYVRNVIGLIDQLPDKKFNEKSRTRQRLSVCSGGFCAGCGDRRNEGSTDGVRGGTGRPEPKAICPPADPIARHCLHKT